MKGNKLTRKEHITRAMLMGRVYDPRDGTYCVDVEGEGLAGSPMLDCNTLEVVPDNKAAYLRVTLRTNVIHWEDAYDTPRMKWEAPDEDTDG